MADSRVDAILEFLQRNKFARAEAALRSEIGNRPDLNGFMEARNKLFRSTTTCLHYLHMTMAFHNTKYLLLTGQIPRLINWNEVLQYLGLRGNSLKRTLSADMCQLTGLWYFDVRGNNLTGTIPDNIDQQQKEELGYSRARPWAILMGVGLGYGANMLTKYLAEVGEESPLAAAKCIDNPFDSKTEMLKKFDENIEKKLKRCLSD